MHQKCSVLRRASHGALVVSRQRPGALWKWARGDGKLAVRLGLVRREGISHAKCLELGGTNVDGIRFDQRI